MNIRFLQEHAFFAQEDVADFTHLLPLCGAICCPGGHSLSGELEPDKIQYAYLPPPKLTQSPFLTSPSTEPPPINGP
jgi:hypothetical protein